MDMCLGYFEDGVWEGSLSLTLYHCDTQETSANIGRIRSSLAWGQDKVHAGSYVLFIDQLECSTVLWTADSPMK